MLKYNSLSLFNLKGRRELLLKNQTGLEQVRVRSQHSLIARSIFSNIGTLLLEMAGTRRKKKVNKPQQIKLFDLAA